MKATLRNIAVQGCCHGELSAIYKSVGTNTELLVICGDFQAIRNAKDFDTISVPNKYKAFKDFHRYYKGELKAPVLTVFIGGNHECSSYLKELKFGGWVAPNIYYLGEFGSVWFKGLQIGGLSGIYNRESFLNNAIDDEQLPYTPSTLRSIYHVKPKNFLKMCLMNRNMDVCLSHDWPAGIEKYGDVAKLLREKKFFKDDINKGTLGSPLNMYLLQYLRPRHWFSAHLHVRFAATVNHQNTDATTPQKKPEVKSSKNNASEIELDMDDDQFSNEYEIPLDMDEPSNDHEIPLDMDSDGETGPRKNSSERPRKKARHESSTTRFLALDKCLPRRKFLERMSVGVKPENIHHGSISNCGLVYDVRAIAVNKVVEEYLKKHRAQFKAIDTQKIANEPGAFSLVSELETLVNIEEKKLRERPQADFIVPRNFKQCAPNSSTQGPIPLQYWPNNQTIEYSTKFGIEYDTPKTQPKNQPKTVGPAVASNE